MRCATAPVSVVGLLVGLVLSLGTATTASAQLQTSSEPAACPSGNLLEGKPPSNWSFIRNRKELATDGAVAPEGTQWDASPAIILETPASTITWDLGALTTVNAAWVQADANDYYTLWGSLDGQVWKDIGRIEPVEGVHGLRGRNVNLGGAAVRFVRFGEGQGDNAYSVSEVQVFCQMPTPFPPKMKVVSAPAAVVHKGFWDFWDDKTSARWELALAVLGFLLLRWGYVLKRDKRPEAFADLRKKLLAGAGVVAALTYVNFGSFHFGNFIHDWEWTHYYLGSKYFKELNYDRLYECIAVADSEESEVLRRRVELRKLTNLRTNALESAREILANTAQCKQHFSAARWTDFKHDVRFFRDRQGAKRWDDLQTDHGYNGTPVWNIAGTVLANMAAASKAQLYTLAMLDPAYLLGTMAVIWWAFGWRVLAVALLAFATNFPSRFYWTGGSYLRWDWLFYLVGAIACLKKEKYFLGGLALGYATLLRVFPGFIFLGPAAALGWYFYQHRKLEPRYTRFFAGAALSVALLVPLSLAVSGGVAGYQRFYQNTVKHKETPLTNYMGLRTVVAWRPSEVGRLLQDERQQDPWKKWKDARLAGYQSAKPLYLLIVGGFLLLLALAARKVEPWAAAALGVTFVPFGVELTSYYYAFIIAVALLYEKREEIGRWLLLLTAFTQFVDWAPLKNMSSWLDEQYTLMSFGTLAVFAAIVWLFAKKEAVPEAATVAVAAPAMALVTGGATSSGPGPEKKDSPPPPAPSPEAPSPAKAASESSARPARSARAKRR